MTERWRVALGLLGVSLAACRPAAKAPTTLEISVPYELDTLDPHAQNLLGNFALMSHVYEPLVTT
ncbi:MAG TPA: ABC transporter substrate-binding protein, partial [Thermoanaerobaculia bacterium]|nr:ABC transporter substrate-binding protein [Thermoanaerobaculia bacterium]